MKTYVIGDIHGAYKALKQCFQKSEFDYAKDHLIVLGDVCDRYPEVKQCFDELLKIKRCDYIIGNHDLWALDWATKGIKQSFWLGQGGLKTIASYDGEEMSQAHVELLKDAHSYLELDNRLFVHGGFEPTVPIEKQDLQTFVWDRDLFHKAHKKNLTDPDFKFSIYKEIFIGHSPTELFNSLEPLNFCNLWNIDTGAGWSGKLTIMNVETKEYWQSDLTPNLYNI